MQVLWSRFTSEVLSAARTREQWQTQSDNPKVGDLVIVLPANSYGERVWEPGIVEKVYNGADGLVRVVRVRTPKGTIKRTFVSLVPVPPESPALPEEDAPAPNAEPGLDG